MALLPLFRTANSHQKLLSRWQICWDIFSPFTVCVIASIDRATGNYSTRHRFVQCRHFLRAAGNFIFRNDILTLIWNQQHNVDASCELIVVVRKFLKNFKQWTTMSLQLCNITERLNNERAKFLFLNLILRLDVALLPAINSYGSPSASLLFYVVVFNIFVVRNPRTGPFVQSSPRFTR